MFHQLRGKMFLISEITFYKRINGTIEMGKQLAYLRANIKSWAVNMENCNTWAWEAISGTASNYYGLYDRAEDTVMVTLCTLKICMLVSLIFKTRGCELIWKWVLYRGNLFKMSSLGWANAARLVFLLKGNSDTDRLTWRRPCELKSGDI